MLEPPFGGAATTDPNTACSAMQAPEFGVKFLFPTQVFHASFFLVFKQFLFFNRFVSSPFLASFFWGLFSFHFVLWFGSLFLNFSLRSPLSFFFLLNLFFFGDLFSLSP